MNEPNADPFDDLDRLRLPIEPSGKPFETSLKTAAFSPKSIRIDGEFLKGPIPMDWLSEASRLSGKAPLAVALAIWFQSGRKKNKTVKLTNETLDRLNVKRKAKYAGLAALEEAKLIKVDQKRGKNPVVTILDFQPKTEDETAIL